MTEDDWLKDRPADRMLEFVADRLAPRQWRFLACGLVRKAWDLLPAGPAREVVEWVELHPDDAPKKAAVAAWQARLDPAADAAAEAASAEMREVVRTADPDAEPQAPAGPPDPDETPPSTVLFDAASRHAAHAVAVVATAARSAARAAANVLLAPGEETFGLIQEQVLEALTQKADANRAMNNALKLKQLGDEFADNFNPKTARLDMSKALAKVGQIEEAAADSADRAERAVRKHVARLLHEVVGNPFREVEFDPAWRSADATAAAEAVFADRSFDKLPSLADALLDADCDAEAVLRHCRGTELHAKDDGPQPHYRGCWVVELVLNRWTPLPKASKAAKPKKPRRPAWLDFDFDEPSLRDDDKLA